MTSRNPLPNIIAHGGAWDWEDSLDTLKRAAVERAIKTGYELLRAGGSAVDAVEQTVVLLENDPVLDAGTGGYLNREGVVQLDALIVDGTRHDFGAVAGATRVRNPISLARRIMEKTEHCFFVGPGADAVAGELGVETVNNECLITPHTRALFRSRQTGLAGDTVGAVAMDSAGATAAATSTSGTSYKPAGRVGDAPLYGSGGYAEDGTGAAGATGLGENIMRLLLCKYACNQMADRISASNAAEAAMRYAEARFTNSMAGLIVIDSEGNAGAAHTTPKLALGWIDSTGKVRSAVNARTLIRGQ